MKLYLHDESSDTTHVLHWEASEASEHDFYALQKKISEVFALEKQGKELVGLRNDKDRVISSNRELKDRMDIFISTRECSSTIPSKISKQNVVTDELDEEPEKKLENLTSSSSVNKMLSQDLNALAENAVKFFQARQYTKAIEAYKTLHDANVDVFGCLSNIATIYLQANQYQSAIKYLNQCLEKDKYNFTVYERLGQSYFGIKDFKQALQYFYNECQLLEKIEQDLRMSNKDSSEFLKRLHIAKVNVGKCLYQLGEKKNAFTFYASVLQKDEKQKEALYEYANYLFRENEEIQDVVSALFRILVTDQNDVPAKELLCEVVSKHGTVELYNQISKDGNLVPAMSPALAWIAQILKEYSCISESVIMYKKALELVPTNVSYLLNLIHTLEIDARHAEALKEVRDFCARNRNLKYGDFTTEFLYKFLNDLNLDEFSDPIQNKDPICSQYYCGEKANKFAEQYETHWVDDYGAAVTRKGEKFNAMAFKERAHNRKKDFSLTNLDLLAVGFTVVKICFVVGILAPLPFLIEVLEWERMKRDLHETQIRNEHAYFCTISQLLNQYIIKTWPTQPLEVENNHIYLVGESHSMSSAYQVISWHGKPTVLLPKLVTGCKCFHLRKDTRFYPKKNFHSVVDTIPPKSTVIFMFGEIDCREGLLVSVERLKYSSVDEGMRTTIGYYMKELVKANEKFDLYVHPAPPVIDITRDTVKMFNVFLQMECNKNGLRYLNFMEDYFTNNGKDLKKELHLDNIHSSPAITKYVEQALNKY